MTKLKIREQRDIEEDPESSEEEPQTRDPHRRRTNDIPTPTQHASNENNENNDDDDDAGFGSEGGGGAANTAAGNITQLARKLCRYALACEYSRQPIRRGDVNAKVLGEGSGRVFKGVWAEAQGMLREVFGMEMVELPRAEKTNLRDRRGEYLILTLMSCFVLLLRVGC